MNRRKFVKTLGAASFFPFVVSPVSADKSDANRQNEKLIFSSPLTHSDWMLKGTKWGPEGVRHMLDACKAVGWSRIHWRVTDAGRATYRSKVMVPSSKWDEDNFWNPQTEADKALFRRFYPNYTDQQRHELIAKFEGMDYSTFDSLAEAVRYGHQIGLQIHAWVTIYEDDHGWGMQSEFSKKHPEFRWIKRDGTPYRSQLSFSFPEVRKYKLAILKELLRNYELDGIFLDWIRTGDVRDNPQNDTEGVANFGYEKPHIDKFKKKFRQDPKEIPNGDDRWVKLRAEPQTEFMRDARRLVRRHNRSMPLSVMVGHPWHYRGFGDKIDGSLRGLLLDTVTWAKEGLADSFVAAGYYRDGGNAEKAWRALREETGGKSDVWLFAWVPANVGDFNQTFSSAKNLGAKQILFWEADYIEGAAPELKTAMSEKARWK